MPKPVRDVVLPLATPVVSRCGLTLAEYRVRESGRAKRVRLTLSPRGGLAVVVPRGFDRSLVPGIVEGKRAWVARAFERTAGRAAHLDASAGPPRAMRLDALDEEWLVEYRDEASPRGTVRVTRSRVLVVTGEPKTAAEALRRWLRTRVHDALEPRLRLIAEERGFTFGRVVARSQRTRWASCSARGTISLNARLLFLPRELVDYVLLHELCHTVHLDHSPRFWRLVEAHEPDRRRLDRGLRDGWRHVPGWVDEAG